MHDAGCEGSVSTKREQIANMQHFESQTKSTSNVKNDHEDREAQRQ